MNHLDLKSILLVDDDEISNLFNKIFINKLDLDIELDFVLNGREALNLLTLNEQPEISLPCLLLLDIRMPVMNGWEFLEAYEKQLSDSIKKNIIIIMLTTSRDEGDMVKATENPNIKEFIQKPLSEKTFGHLITKYFNNIELKS